MLLLVKTDARNSRTNGLLIYLLYKYYIQVGQVRTMKCYHRKPRITILNSNHISQGQKRRIWHKFFEEDVLQNQWLRKKPGPKKYQLIDLIFIFSSALKLSVYENTLLSQGLLSLFQLSGKPSRRTLWLKLNNVILLT